MKKNLFFELLNEGRISNIISALQNIYNCKNISDIPTKDKLLALCDCLKLSVVEFDTMIAENSPVLRTVKGHAFEVALQHLLELKGIAVSDIGGDSNIDLTVNGHQLQLKTPNIGGTTETEVEYKTHKTHGAKSEKESMEYYHTINSFADYFVGLVSYSPFQVFIIPKEKLERHSLNNSYIQSPFKIQIKDNPYLNNFKQIGIIFDNSETSCIEPFKQELMPLTSHKIGINSKIILDTILRNCNFRIWDMSIRGFAREVALKSFLDNQNINYSNKPTELRKKRGDKSDLAIKKYNGEYIFIQVKGISTNNCIFNKENSIIATETQLTRGRVNDHPTQSRLYLETDFDYLLLCLDPPISYMVGIGEKWIFCIISSSKLKKHSKITNRFNSLQKFTLQELLKHEMTIKSLMEMLS
ncbi:hypothetical protein EZS27_025129 [termite gut metagenome]|uniref:Uncharacterized protein n=1 Tax=termite gut metagenome TaxID=433724 RepID=A0A5J4QXR7_9ZZZZ